ncbi:glyoxylase-like metal-dependent hydrolase (beta-lactamase superfamily II) [Luteibacter rhizovicinus]|uniref:Glyoxylase-like metal-dependent hydrolase (Beta-lactamase superfamily II) n=1 Tax=Luteibacter rhizovicinus TaxID=242606 RepID=A0A4R3YMJ3_9GAMM|nr:MBL fold metallo-hydrolase [Luteibacter rhizovicinus]TCV93432.1 glyoxylase-like metal-dependent hydrolase (beta-lactamase superfamily II) [Luteibacter rhizovicinus]
MKSLHISRRTLCALVALAFAASAAPVYATAPMMQRQAPGFYRMMLGNDEIIALSDGTFDLPTDKLLVAPDPKRMATLLARAHDGTAVETTVNAFLVNTGSKLILIDTGSAELLGPTLGKVLDNLRAAGYQPEQVDEVLITHLHVDHVGGLLNNGKPSFPNATVRVSKAEADYWLNPANKDKAPESVRSGFVGAAAALKPYIDAGRFKTFSGAAVLEPGITAVASPGHTPGHVSYRVESQGKTMLFWGDLVHVADVQFAAPAITIAFDSDQPAARSARTAAYADAARKGYWVAGAHLPFPGIGHVESTSGGNVWAPVAWSENRAAGP